MSRIAANIEAVQARIAAAVRRAGRRAEEITLVAVTKTHPPETVIEAWRCGLRHFGENRAAEGTAKMAQVAQRLVDLPEAEQPVWHFIGHLQSRQAGDVLGRFALIHSVDSLKLAQRLQRLAVRDGHPRVEILLECNVSGETSKYGFALHRWESSPEQLGTFIDTAAQIGELDRLVVRGLMTMAPWTDNPETVRPVFRSLARLREVLQKELPHLNWQELSMGMTDDFEVAIEEGATMVRIGRALFGERL